MGFKRIQYEKAGEDIEERDDNNQKFTDSIMRKLDYLGICAFVILGVYNFGEAVGVNNYVRSFYNQTVPALEDFAEDIGNSAIETVENLI